MRSRIRALEAAALLFAGAALGSGPAAAQRAGAMVKTARADFADMAGGTYLGELVADSRGPSRPGVRATVVRSGANAVRVTFDHPRLPAFTARLTRAMDKLRNVGGEAVFLLDLSSRPRTLTVTVDGATWTGTRQ